MCELVSAKEADRCMEWTNTSLNSYPPSYESSYALLKHYRQYVRYGLYGGGGLGIFIATTSDINRTVEANDEPMRADQMEDLNSTIEARTANAKFRW